MHGFDPDHEFGFLVADIARLQRERFNGLAQNLGLTLAQARVLTRLATNEGISQTALAGILEVQPITLLRQVDRLEAAGLLERRPNPSDRRAQQLYLTPASQPLLEQIRVLGTALQDRIMSGLSVDQRDALLAALLGIRSRLAGGPAALSGVADGLAAAEERTPCPKP